MAKQADIKERVLNEYLAIDASTDAGKALKATKLGEYAKSMKELCWRDNRLMAKLISAVRKARLWEQDPNVGGDDERAYWQHYKWPIAEINAHKRRTRKRVRELHDYEMIAYIMHKAPR